VTDTVFLSFLLPGLCPRGCFTEVLSSQAKCRLSDRVFLHRDSTREYLAKGLCVKKETKINNRS